MKWILIVAYFSTMNMSGATMSGRGQGQGIAMQEFSSLQSCQFASVEAQKIAPGIRIVCVPKGGN